jgi:hypothetical protein
LPTTAQTLDIRDAIRTYATLSNTTVTMSGKAELRITGTGNPIAGSVIHLNSPDAWLLMTAFEPSQVTSTFLGRVRVNGANAVIGSNVRVVQYGQGAVLIPHGPDFSPLEVFDGRYFTGPSRRLNSYVEYDDALLGPMARAIGSFRLKRGYMATFAQQENGVRSFSRFTATCTMGPSAPAPCQWRRSGSIRISEPGPCSSIGPPARWRRQEPLCTRSTWVPLWACQCVRARGSKRT